MQWHNQSFQTLDTLTLYRLLQLRSRIFVVEQNCVFLDLDDQDQQARHLFYGNQHEIAAYARILRLPESHTAQAAIGRIVVAEAHRRRDLAHRQVAVAQQGGGSLLAHLVVQQAEAGAGGAQLPAQGALGHVQFGGKIGQPWRFAQLQGEAVLDQFDHARRRLLGRHLRAAQGQHLVRGVCRAASRTRSIATNCGCTN